jgi:hypothetical protein
MKFKSILLTATATLSLATATMAQLPNYVPTNGLTSYWLFTGNPNDNSGNNYNGTVTGASLTSDRFGNNNCEYNFTGTAQYITTLYPGITGTNDRSFSLWFKQSTGNNGSDQWPLFFYGGGIQGSGFSAHIFPSNIPVQGNKIGIDIGNSYVVFDPIPSINQWHHLVITYSPNFGNNVTACKVYLDNVLLANIAGQFNTNIQVNTGTGQPNFTIGGNPNYAQAQFLGAIDDIGIWNRELSQQEITDLYNAVNCANNTAITPQTNSLTIGSTANLTATTSDPNPTYIWQSDLGQGFQTLNNFGNYSGVNTNALSIANVQLSEHNQPIRVISTSGNCIDTSNVAIINILDTCIVTVYDTLLTTVTDTLIINTQITGINPPNNLNTLKVFPNPANTHINIDYGNFNSMSGYTLKIVNSVGQTVFTTPINQQTSYINLSTWTGSGIYYIQLINPQNNTIENRKIVIQ